MLTIEKTKPNQLDLTIDGDIDADEMKRGLNDLLDLSADFENGRMLYIFKSFKMPSLGALGVELSMMPRLFGLLSRFDRIALLSDTAWLRTAAEAEGKVLPGITIKSFPLDQPLEAQTWLDREAP